MRNSITKNNQFQPQKGTIKRSTQSRLKGCSRAQRTRKVSRQMGHELFDSCSMQSMHRQTWPQSSRMTSRGFVKQTTQLLGSLASPPCWSLVCVAEALPRRLASRVLARRSSSRFLRISSSRHSRCLASM